MTDNLIGTSIWGAAALPATNNTAGFEALTWVKINGLIAAPVFGITHANIDVPDLQSGFTGGVKGAGTGDDTSATFRAVGSDTGQGNVETAANSPAGIFSLKIVKRGSGTANAPAAGDAVEYAQGYVHSYKDNQADGGQFEGFTVNFKQNDFTIKDVEPS